MDASFSYLPLIVVIVFFCRCTSCSIDPTEAYPTNRATLRLLRLFRLSRVPRIDPGRVWTGMAGTKDAAETSYLRIYHLDKQLTCQTSST